MVETAAVQFELDVVVLVPTGRPPHKVVRDGEDPGPAVRLELTRAAAEGNPRLAVDGFEVDSLESNPGRPSYTLDTLEFFAEADRYGGGRPLLILGSDVAASLASWHEPAAVLQLADVVVAARPGFDVGLIAEVVDELGGKAPRVVEMPQIDISSTFIRQRAAAGGSLRYLVPDAVREAVESRGLYS